jgi:predicted DsbA family dithiol-disulfide isomerase
MGPAQTIDSRQQRRVTLTTTETVDHPRLAIDVWSDIMCPFCYMGDTLLAQALERFPHATSVDVAYRSYQLMPDLPLDRATGVIELLVREKGIPRAHAETMNANVAERGRQIGLEYHFDRALAVNTRAAHRLTHFARQEGRQHALMLRLFRGYFTEGLHLGDYEVLADLAAEVGLERAAALDVLVTGAFESDVEADIAEAHAIGITGVPFFIFGGTHAVSGAQPVEVFTRALDAAWKANVEA